MKRSLPTDGETEAQEDKATWSRVKLVGRQDRTSSPRGCVTSDHFQLKFPVPLFHAAIGLATFWVDQVPPNSQSDTQDPVGAPVSRASNHTLTHVAISNRCPSVGASLLTRAVRWDSRGKTNTQGETRQWDSQ